MLFLLNKAIVDIETPELYLAQNWQRIGCGDPVGMMASDAVNFAVMVVNAHIHDGIEIERETHLDLAALLITKTGANAALFTGTNEARLNVLSETVLNGLQEELSTGKSAQLTDFWKSVA